MMAAFEDKIRLAEECERLQRLRNAIRFPFTPLTVYFQSAASRRSREKNLGWIILSSHLAFHGKNILRLSVEAFPQAKTRSREVALKREK